MCTASEMYTPTKNIFETIRNIYCFCFKKLILLFRKDGLFWSNVTVKQMNAQLCGERLQQYLEVFTRYGLLY